MEDDAAYVSRLILKAFIAVAVDTGDRADVFRGIAMDSTSPVRCLAILSSNLCSLLASSNSRLKMESVDTEVDNMSFFTIVRLSVFS